VAIGEVLDTLKSKNFSYPLESRLQFLGETGRNGLKIKVYNAHVEKTR